MAELLLLATFIHGVYGQASVVAFPQAVLIDGCYWKDARYYSPSTNETQTSTIYDCQKECVGTPGCAYFGFWPSTGSCYLAAEDATFTTYLAEGGYTGPAVCPNTPSVCTEIPSPAYPALNTLKSKLAWPAHMVPSKLSCWPKDYIGKKYKACPTVTVLEDTKNGWPGKCHGLLEVEVPYKETCESSCSKQVACSVWQEVENTYPLPPRCFQTFWSSGYDCYTRNFANGSLDTTFKPMRSQRIMKGEVRVLKKLSFVDIEDLRNVFDENYFAEPKEAVKACQMACYSDLGCQWWVYSRTEGCFLEDISYKALPVPLTSEHYKPFSVKAADILEGEYIQHQCKEAGYAAISSTQKIPEYSETTTTTTTTSTTTAFAIEFSTTGIFVFHHDAVAGAGAGAAAAAGAALDVNKREQQVHPTELLAAGGVVVEGVDLNLIPVDLRTKLSERLALIISASTGLSKYDVLDLNNEAGKVSIQSWQPGWTVVRRLQTTHPAIKAVYKLMNPDGKETFTSVQNELLDQSFNSEVQNTCAMMLANTAAIPDARSLTATGTLREPEPNDLLPAGAEKVRSHGGNMQLWLWVLGAVLVAMILGIIYWLFAGNAARNQQVSFSRKSENKQVQFQKFSQDDDEAPMLVKKQGVASPKRGSIPEAEARALQEASRLSQEVALPYMPQDNMSGGMSGGYGGYTSGGYRAAPPLYR